MSKFGLGGRSIEKDAGKLAVLQQQAAQTGSPTDHGALTGLGDDDHTQYLLANGGRALSGNLTLTAGVTIDGMDPSAHIANVNAHHNQAHNILGGDHTVSGGIAFDLIGQDAANSLARLTPSDNPGSTAAILKTSPAGALSLQSVSAVGVGSNLVPELTDTYDLGSSIRLWRKGWLSEIESVRFVENAVVVMGGFFMIPHASGTLGADVAGAATQIDFGQAMTPNDFVIFRGNGAVEYVQVGTLASGTTYNVTRNLDGSGANSWPAGQVYAVLGNSGDGRIELDAQTAGPRISVFEQGATYNAQDELVRIGDMTGWGSYTGHGIGVGDPSGNHLKADAGGLALVAGDGDVNLDTDGLSISIGSTYDPKKSVKFLSGTFEHGRLYAYAPGSGAAQAFLTARSNTSPVGSATLVLEAISQTNTQAYLSTRFSVLGGLSVGDYGNPGTGSIVYTGTLYSRKNSTNYGGYITVPLATKLTSTSWDGDSKTAVNNGTIDLSAVFGVPAGVKAVLARFALSSATVGSYAYIGASSSNLAVGDEIKVANRLHDNFGIVPCNGSGDLYFLASGTVSVYLEIFGYLL